MKIEQTNGMFILEICWEWSQLLKGSKEYIEPILNNLMILDGSVTKEKYTRSIK